MLHYIRAAFYAFTEKAELIRQVQMARARELRALQLKKEAEQKLQAMEESLYDVAPAMNIFKQRYTFESFWNAYPGQKEKFQRLYRISMDVFTKKRQALAQETEEW